MFDSIPVVPVKLKKTLKDTVFVMRYLEELIMGYVDNLNLLYVALTRAEETLIAGLPSLPEKGNASQAGHLILQSALLSQGESRELLMDFSLALSNDRMEIGALKTVIATREDQPSAWELDSYPVLFRQEKLRLSLKSNDYFSGAKVGQNEPVDFGTVMHEMFGSIKTGKDVEDAVNEYHRKGIITSAAARELSMLIREKIGSDLVREWYSDKYEVINEREIFTDGRIYRPDRVMIDGKRAIVLDYKFGEGETAAYERQVRNYSDLLQNMGFGPVEAYLWYVMSDKVIRVQ